MLERETYFYTQSVSEYTVLATMYMVDQRGTIEIRPSLHFTVLQTSDEVKLGCGGSGGGERVVDRFEVCFRSVC